MEIKTLEQHVLAELADLEKENERLKDALKIIDEFFPDYWIDFIEKGRKQVLQDAVVAVMPAGRGKDGFSKWCRAAIYKLPDFMTYADFREEFENELRSLYEAAPDCREAQDGE